MRALTLENRPSVSAACPRTVQEAENGPSHYLGRDGSPKIQVQSAHDQPASRPTVPPIQAHPFETLERFQTSLLAAKDFNSLLSILVNALHDDGGFTRVALALLNPGDTDQLLGRVVVGVGADTPTQYLSSFTGSLSADHPLFLQILKRHDPLLVSNVSAENPQSLHA